MKRIRYDETHRQKARDMRASGLNDRQIANEMGINYQTVRNWFAATPRMAATGSATGRAKAGATDWSGVKGFKQAAQREPSYETLLALVKTLTNRVITLESDAVNQSVLRLIERKPEHLDLIIDLYDGTNRDREFQTGNEFRTRPNGAGQAQGPGATS